MLVEEETSRRVATLDDFLGGRGEIGANESLVASFVLDEIGANGSLVRSFVLDLKKIEYRGVDEYRAVDEDQGVDENRGVYEY